MLNSRLLSNALNELSDVELLTQVILFHIAITQATCSGLHWQEQSKCGNERHNKLSDKLWKKLFSKYAPSLREREREKKIHRSFQSLKRGNFFCILETNTRVRWFLIRVVKVIRRKDNEVLVCRLCFYSRERKVITWKSNSVICRWFLIEHQQKKESRYTTEAGGDETD